MNFTKRICCIGAGYVGGPTMAMIALKCPEYKVTVVDINKQRIEDWQSDNLPIFEPGLLEIVKKVLNKNLFFSTEVEKAIIESEIVFVSVNTPTKTFGIGSGKTADLQYWEQTARTILKVSTSDKIVIEKSTLPVKTASAMASILNSNHSNVHFEIISNPEFLAEGTAMNDLEDPDRILIGSAETKLGLKARQEIVEIYANWVDKSKIITSNLWSAELSKLVANAFLAQRISSINSISALCEKTGADITEVSKAVGSDTRIGNKFITSSIGFGGSCFKKDILNLVYICESLNLKEVAEYWENVLKINDYQVDRFVSNMIHTMFGTLKNKKITILGCAFKANTSDTRESPAIYVIKKLLEEDAFVTITDPKALKNAKYDLKEHIKEYNVSYKENVYDACVSSHALVVLTEWKEYKELDFEQIYRDMEKPAFIFDGRNILEHKKLFDIGFNVYQIGKNSLSHL
jgi:UDPglucose 6-dehydrogenase